MGPMALLPLRRKCALRIFITHKNPPSSAGPEPANTPATRPPTAATTDKIELERTELKKQNRNSQEHDVFRIFSSRVAHFEIMYQNNIVTDKSLR
jgi:hypothetical protein